ncbi:MAG TPA: polysaccharide biosynthesis/export family protein [Methylomirabilota bacterium]|nr:polysaccharide biosynthesis/export family protein [Methylomirabilota bacterium]
MNKNSFGEEAQVHRRVLKFSLLLAGAFMLAGCETSKFYDASQQPASGQTPPYASPKRTVSTPAPSDNFSFQYPTTDSPNSQMIILHEGDIVKISFPASQNLDATQQIRLDGKVSLPLVGDVQASGLTPAQLQQNLIKLYAPQISSSEINVSVESSSFPVFVTGCVLRPGKVLSNQPMTALEAIMEAGGFDYARANLKNIHIVRHEKSSSQSYVLDLKTVLSGDQKDDFFLKPDDIIYVPEKFSWF